MIIVISFIFPLVLENNYCQNEPANRLLFGNMEAMDSMLQQLAYYKRHDPAVAEEVASISFSINHSHFLSQVELMENLFDCLCSLMLEVTNRERFLKGEGLQLMNLMLRYSSHCLYLAILPIQGKEEVEIWCLESSFSCTEWYGRHRQLHQVHRHTWLEDALPSLHENPKAVQASRSLC